MSEPNGAVETAIPDDYKAFQAFRDSGGGSAAAEEEAPATGEEDTSQSGPAEEAGEIAEDSDTEEDSQQEDGEEEEEGEEGEEEIQEDEKPKNKRLSKRMSKMSGEIKALKSRLAELGDEPTEGEEEATEEVVSSTETQNAGEEKPLLKRPRLSDYEDNEETGQSAWDQYEGDLETYNDARTEVKVQAALDKQRQELDLKHAKDAADADWNKAASRFSDYNEVVTNPAVKISQAMEVVMRGDAESGTALAYYLGQHPEESERIARSTLAASEREWGPALALAGRLLGVIQAKLPEPGKKPAATTAAAPPVALPKKPVAPPITTKKFSSASRPPTILRGGPAKPAVSVTNEDDAADYRKWHGAREAQLRRK